MLYPPVSELLEHVDSRYLLVNLIAHRARNIAEEVQILNEDEKDDPTMKDDPFFNEKPVTIAIHEVADGELTATVKDEYKN